MSKAKERVAKLIIPKQVDDVEELCRFYFIKGYHQAEKDLTDKAKVSSGWDGFYYGQGYHQAEKDLKLTWEDIPEILRISEELKTSWWFRDNEQTKLIGTQVFWEEVLKRFKERR